MSRRRGLAHAVPVAFVCVTASTCMPLFIRCRVMQFVDEGKANVSVPFRHFRGLMACTRQRQAIAKECVTLQALQRISFSSDAVRVPGKNPSHILRGESGDFFCEGGCSDEHRLLSAKWCYTCRAPCVADKIKK